MTRGEEIINAASEYGCLDKGETLLAFTKGAKWADKTMIEKVCEWLRDNIDMYAEVVLKSNAFYPEIVMCDTFEKNFIKAMEE